MAERLDTPRSTRRPLLPRPRLDQDTSGKVSESIARFLGTPTFILWLTLFCVVWLLWNSLAPEDLRFDRAANGFTALTLMLSLQASYAAPLILLAQNRQTDRDRVQADLDRTRAERNLADTEFLAREVAALRIALNEVATRDFVRSELRNLLEDLLADDEGDEEGDEDAGRGEGRGEGRSRGEGRKGEGRKGEARKGEARKGRGRRRRQEPGTATTAVPVVPEEAPRAAAAPAEDVAGGPTGGSSVATYDGTRARPSSR
ncbi:hypothetical protein Cma02nite_30910 [Cellulomonas marina]|uniref:Uncharacterized membrane protein n=1 Tax=Cellulomonas marina TaxID=988821 RepID=A0A1I1A1U2_9CELL|nr:DUF1003 domain-containing protein [Cellulomonas marina]GIG30491.1 hypothetical protein Cma02nite_30910 [Cellulomonas marina]SFB31867.1 Uncharacterized membrane protein [Cellulomonas marina]